MDINGHSSYKNGFYIIYYENNNWLIGYNNLNNTGDIFYINFTNSK